MIKYALRCASGHRFEGWFSSSADFDRQRDEAVLSCPACGTSEVEKALMAPAVIGSRGSREVQERVADLAREWNGFAAKAKAHVEATCENVGDRFPEEARKQHYGEAEAKPIYGQATRKEAEALKEEGVAITPVPEPLPKPGQVKKKLN